jgi:hypothetical protein
MKPHHLPHLLAAASIGFLSSATLAQTPAPAPAAKTEATTKAVQELHPEPLFATVNGAPITRREFHTVYANYLREKFYHREVPENLLAEAKQTVTDAVIDRRLLLEDAARRGIVADEKSIDETIAGYDTQYASSPRWKENRETMLPGLRQQLTEQSILGQMEAIGRSIPEITEEAAQAYYKANPELFTEPEKLALHTILLKVDPAAPDTVWNAAREEAQRIGNQIKSGTSFEELARLHSNDRSANDGGNMGYVHKGMIPLDVQEKIESVPLGTATPAIDVLEGVAIFRLDERVAPRLRDYASVAPRVKDLMRRELVEKAWLDFRQALRSKADIKVFEMPLPPAPPIPAK